MANQIFKNFVTAVEIDNQLESQINHTGFCTIDKSLAVTPGMIKKFRRYQATPGVEKLKMGEGNKKSIETKYTEEQYEVQLAQTRFIHFDEEGMIDPTAIVTGTRQMTSDLYNTINSDVIAEFYKTSNVLSGAKLGFDLFADAAGMIKTIEFDNDPEKIAPKLFCLIHKDDKTAVRKALKDDLQYVEAFARTGYVGTVGGVSIVVDALAQKNKLVIATRKAVTLFEKTGIQVESQRDANTRKDEDYARKYYIAALTDEYQAVVADLAVGG